jgi:hypothetical protein
VGAKRPRRSAGVDQLLKTAGQLLLAEVTAAQMTTAEVATPAAPLDSTSTPLNTGLRHSEILQDRCVPLLFSVTAMREFDRKPDEPFAAISDSLNVTIRGRRDHYKVHLPWSEHLTEGDLPTTHSGQ